MHALSAAEPGSSALIALPTLGLLNRVHDYASAALGRNALSARRFQLFASTTRELSGLSFRDGATEMPSDHSRKEFAEGLGVRSAAPPCAQGACGGEGSFRLVVPPAAPDRA